MDSRDYVLRIIYYSVLVRNTLSTLPANTTLTSTGSAPRVSWAAFNPVNRKHLYNIYTMLNQRRGRLADVVQMFAGNSSWSGIAHCWRRLQADTDPMYIKCWAIVAGAGQYPFNHSQYFMLPVPVWLAQCFEPKPV